VVVARETVIVKRQAPDRSRLEHRRTLAGQAVGERTGLFTVPRILAADDAGGEITFERLTLTDFRTALVDPGRRLELIDQAALALAAIHTHLEVGRDSRRCPPGALGMDLRRPQVPLHGDYGMRNVFIQSAGPLAVIDWSNADWIAVDADLAPPEVDLAVFLISLFHRRLLARWPPEGRRDLTRRFLATYAAAAPHGVDLASLAAAVRATAPGFARLTRRRIGLVPALACRHALIDLKLFLSRLGPDDLSR